MTDDDNKRDKPVAETVIGMAVGPAARKPAAAAPAPAETAQPAEPKPREPAAATVILTDKPAGEKPAPATVATVVLGPSSPAAAASTLSPDRAAAVSAETLSPEHAASVAAATSAGHVREPLKRSPEGATVPNAGSGIIDVLVGSELGGYEIKRKLAEGGMGVVFEGEHLKIGRRGAIKVLKAELCASDEVVERFYQEARAVNSIRHENIVDIYDFGRDHIGRAFFVMEFLDGETLGARLKRGPLRWSLAYRVLGQTLRALKAAHAKGFVHRDLKPDNIWLKPSGDDPASFDVKLLDFGIAKLTGDDNGKDKLTRTGTIMGTPHYMSPEQINGAKDLDQRTDIYAMGVITYEMFAGKTPFVGETLQAVMTGHLFNQAPRLADLPDDLGVPGPIAEIVERMLAKDPAARYQTVDNVLSDLKDIDRNATPTHARALADKPLTTVPTAGVAKPAGAAKPVAAAATAAAEPRKGGSGTTIAVLGLAVVAAGGFAVWKLRSSGEPAHETAATQPAPPPQTAPKPGPESLDYSQLRKDAQTTLRASVKETEPTVRVHGADALGQIKDEPSVPTLTELATKDPDDEVRGHAASALGALAATSIAADLGKLETAAAPPLKAWYASALAHLGDRHARERLAKYASDKDLKVSFKAALALADVAAPGDKAAIAALRAQAAHEAELDAVVPYAGAVLLGRLAALHDEQARKILAATLAANDEGSRLAAAQALARLGDDSGKQVLAEVATNTASPNQLAAAVGLVALGDYSGYELMANKLVAKEPDVRRLAARGLGEIAERKSLAALVKLASDADWTVRVAGAVAVIAIVGLDPQVLAQASVDWTKSALGSDDLVARKAAAGVIGDMPEDQAVPLLASAIADKDATVRLAASHSARKLKTAAAATQIATAAKAETDPKVKEEQVRALGAIGSPVAHDTLAEIATDPGRVGVFASGSLIAVGDTSGKARLDKAVVDANVDLRLAAVESATEAHNPVVVPTLVIGAGDRVFDVRFTAAEGLASYHAEKQVAVPILKSGLDSKDAAVQARAETALLSVGEKLGTDAPTPAAMLDSSDAKVRLAAVTALAELNAHDASALLRRAFEDADADVRHAAVDAVEQLVKKDKDVAIKLYKQLVDSSDPVVRSKAQGQLSRLVEPPPKLATVAPPPAPPAAQPQPASVPDAAVAEDVLPKVQPAADDASKALAEAKAAVDAVTAAVATISASTEQPAKDDDAIKHADQLANDVTAAADKADAAATRAEAAAKAAADAAGAQPSPEVAKLVAAATKAATDARAAVTAARSKADAAASKAREYAKAETQDPQMYVAAADAAIATANYADAKHDLDKAAQLFKASGKRNASIDYSYGQLYDKMARREKDPDAKRKLLERAKQSYETFAGSGSGPRVQRATDRAAEIADEIKQLGNP